jgi:hypothetical protein
MPSVIEGGSLIYMWSHQPVNLVVHPGREDVLWDLSLGFVGSFFVAVDVG